MGVPEREARASGYSEAMADHLTGILDRIEEQLKEARAIAATAAEGDPTALDELTGPIEEMATAVAAQGPPTRGSPVAAQPDGTAKGGSASARTCAGARSGESGLWMNSAASSRATATQPAATTNASW